MVRIGRGRGARIALGIAVLHLLGLGLFLCLESLAQGRRSERFVLPVLFKDVVGLRPGSRVMHRGLVVGEVAGLSLDPEAGRVRALLSLRPEAGSLVRSTTQVWTVRPRLGLLTRELSGLDTLIKESYLQVRVREGGVPLASGEELLGLEGPPPDLAGETLEDLEPGDLVGSVLLERNHGLAPGSPVLFRGVRVGEVRALGLLESGAGLSLEFAVYREYRRFVVDESRFWVSRPLVRGSVLAGISVEDLASLLTPALVFDSPSGFPPAVDEASFVDLAVPPEPRREDRPSAASPAPVVAARTPAPGGRRLAPLVTVRYRAVDRNTLRADTVLQAEGQGVLYRDPGGDYRVLTGRSACDGTYLKRARWYDRLRLAEESIRVLLQDGRIYPASRIWVDPEGDLALLVLRLPSGSIGAPLPPWREALDFSVEDPALPEPQGDLATGPLLLALEGKFVGVHGRAGPGERSPGSYSFTRVPVALRPGGE